MKRKILSSALLWLFAAMFSSSGFSQIQIGTGSSDQSLPIQPYYGYTYSQVIYLQPEINAAGDITELKWYFDGSSLSNSNNWTIYIGHTAKTAFSSTSDWIDVSSLTQVWSGTFVDPGASGWITFDITDFTYNNNDNLVVAVDENASGYNGTSDDFYSTSVSGYRGLEYHSDMTNPNPSSPPSGSRRQYIANIILGGITVLCPIPSDQTTSNVATTSVDLGWTENGTATTWDIEWGAAGFTQGTGTTIAVTTNPYPLTGLSANTAYDWYVRADCGGGNGQSAWVGPDQFTTPVPIQSVPYTEDWETGAIGSAWNTHTGSNATLQVNTVSKHNGTYGLEQYGDDNNYRDPTSLANAYNLAQPGGLNDDHTSWNLFIVDLAGATSPSLSFWYAMGYNYNNNRNNFWVQVDDGTGWVDLFATQANVVAIPYEKKIIDLSAYVGDTVDIRFFHNGKNDVHYLYLDDISVLEITCPEPIDQTVDNIALTSVDLGWTESGTATTWDIEWGPAGFTQGTGTTITGTTTNPYPLSGLSVGTSYDWYVRADCGGGNGQSFWAGPASFSTLAPVQTLPFTEDWETGSIGTAWNQHAGIKAALHVNAASKHDGAYGLEQYGDWNSGYSGPASLAVAYSRAQPGGLNEDWTTWNSFTVDLSAASNPELSFWYSMGYNSHDNGNNFWVQIDAGSGWIDLFATQTNGSTIPYQKKVFNLSAYNGGNVHVRFFHNGRYSSNYLYLDDILVMDITCPEPTDQVEYIFPTTANLGWTENGTATTWDIEWGAPGFAQGTGTTITGTTTNPYTLSGLTANTSYDWYVRADCGGGDGQSFWAGPSSFTTLLPAVNMPFTENWETGSIGTEWNHHAGSHATLEVNAASKHNGAYGLEHYGDDAGYTQPSGLADAYAKAQPGGVNEDWTTWNSFAVDLTAATAPELSFWYAMGYLYSNHNFFWVQVDAGSGWVDLFAVQNTSAIPYEQKFYDLSAYIGGTVHIRFFHSSRFVDNYLYLDDISVHEYTCPIPTDQTTGNIATTSVDLGWTENGTATAWDIEYGAPGYTQGTGTAIAGVTDNPYPLSGLTARTDYDWYVRTFCDPDYTTWTGPDSFTTLALTQSVPFAEDWETGSIGSAWNTYTGSNATLQVNTDSKHDGAYGLEHNYAGSGGWTAPSSLADAYTKAQPGGANESVTSWNSFTLDLTAATSPRLSFWYAMGNSTSGNNNFFWVQVDAGSGWIDLFSRQTVGSAIPYEKKELYLSAYTGGTVMIRFFHNGYYDLSHLYLDDISVVEIPCPEPTNQTTSNIAITSVDLGWTENGSATTWDIEYGPVGFTQGTGTTITGTILNPYPLSGLSGGTDYDWYVRSFCDPDYTTWTGPDPFRTLAPVQSLPFAEDWETGSMGTAWNTHTGNLATLQTSTASKHNGTYGLEQYGDGSDWTRPSSIADAYTKAQPGGVNEDWTSWNSFTVDFTAAASPGLSFWYAMGYYSSYNDNYFWVQIDAGLGWVDLFSTQTNLYSIPYEKKILDLAAHAGGIVDIRFLHSGKYDNNYLYLDDIVAAEITCLEPTDQTVVNLAMTSADLGWTENGAATTWDIEYGAAGFAQGTGTTITGVTSNPYPLSGLSSGITYDWYVRADCGGGNGQSFWAGPHSFTTIIIQLMPFVEDWETGSIGSAWSAHTGSMAALFVNTSSKHNGTYGLKQYGNTNTYTAPSGLADAYTKAQPGGANESGTSWNSFTVDLTAASAPELSFWYAMGYYFGNSNNNFWAQVDAGSGWIDLFSTQTNGSSIPYEEKTFDLSTYIGGTVTVRFFHNGHYDDNYLYLDDISVFEYPCRQPTNQTTNNILSTSVDLGWTENGTATTWDIEYGAQGFTQGTGTTINGVVANPYALTGLTMATDYDWYVRADCGGGNGQSTWAGPDPFTTFDPVQTVPFTEDWETGSVGILWGTHTGSKATLQVNTASKHNGTYGLEQYGNGSNSDYTTPTGLADAYTKAQPGGANEDHTSWNTFTVDLTATTAPGLSFWYAMGYQYNNNYNNFWVQVDAGSGWVDLFSRQTSGAVPYEQKECILYAYVGGTVDIRFFHNGKYDDNYLYLDDISVLEVACPEPIDQTTSNLSSTSVDLGWTQVGTATTWDIEWGAVGFAQGTGTTITGVTANPYPLSGLTMCTTYDWYVRADCGGGNGQSIWTGPSSFTTFSIVQPMPFTEDWETGTIGSAWCTHTGSNATQQVNAASKHDGAYGLEQYGDGGNWTTPSGLADAYTKAQLGGVNENKTSWNSFTVDLSTATSPSLSFWYAMGHRSNNNYSNFWTQIDDGTGWVDLFAVQPNGSSIPYEKKTIDISAYIGGIVSVRFFHSGKYDDNYLYLDDISVAEYTCPEPTDQTVGNIALTSVDLGWTENGTSTAWDIEWGAAGFVQGNGTTITGTTSNPYPLAGLTAGTAYDWYVRADCGNGSSSSWTGPHTFSTSINSFPWSEDFENNGDMPYGWTQEYVSGTHIWVFQTGGYNNSNPSSAHGGTHNAAFTYISSGTKTNLVTPQFDLAGQQNPQLTFWHTQAVWDGDQDELRVYYRTSQTGSWTMIAEYTSSITSWTQEVLNLPNTSSTYYVAFEGLDGCGYGVCVDDVEVSCSGCPAPTGLFADNISQTSVDLNWTTGGAATWNIEWGATGFAQGNGTLIAGTITNPHFLSGLAAGTVYDFYVQDDCVGSQSSWTGPSSFTTLCDAITSFPWTEDFENNGVLPLCWSEEYVTGAQDWTFHTGGYDNDNPPTAHGGTYNACFLADDYGITTKLVTPQLDIGGQAAPKVSFWHTQEDWGGDQDVLRVYYRTSETGNWTMIAEYTSSIASWTQEVLDLPNASATYYIAFEGISNFGYGVCIDDVSVYDNTPMIWVSSTCTQNTDYCYRVDLQQIIGIEIVTQHHHSPIEVTSFNVGMNGSTSGLGPLQDLRIYCTGNSPQYSTSNRFNPDTYNPSSLPANFDVAGSQALSEGTNYFWLTINVGGNAIVGETVDAECLQITASAKEVHVPTVTAPPGSREIHADMQWTGTASNDWNDASNWSPAGPPDAYVPIEIPSGTPNSLQLNGELVINDNDGTYNCYALDIHANATVTNTCGLGVFGDMAVSGTYTSTYNSSNSHKVYGGGQLTIGTNGAVDIGNAANGEADLAVGHDVGSGGTLDVQGGSLNVADQVYLYANANVIANNNATIWVGKGGGGSAYSADNPATFYVENGATGTIDNATIKVCGKETGGYHSVNILSPGFDFSTSSTLEICHGDYATHYDANVNIVDGADLANFMVNKPGNVVTVESNLGLSDNFTVGPGAQLTLETGSTITVAQNFLLESDNGGTASFINNGTLSISGNTTSQRYLTGGVWHDISAPVNGATVNSLYFNGNPDVWLRTYNEPDNTRTYVSQLTTPMHPGQGFEVWVETGSDVTGEFVGPLQAADLTLNSASTPPMSYSGPDPLGFNLIGNPFTSALDWDIGSWNQTDMAGTIWVWDNITGNYKTRNSAGAGDLADGIIPTGQGFFVQATASTASITIPMDARVHSAQAFYKNARGTTNAPPHVVFTVNKEMRGSGVWVTFSEGDTDGFDLGHDVREMTGSDSSPKLYLVEGDEQYCIDALPPLDGETRLVPMHFMAGSNGTHILEASDLDQLPWTDIFLEDLLMGHVQDLRITPDYSFEAETGQDPNRFLIHFNPVTTEVNDPDAHAAINIYAWGNEIYIVRNDEKIAENGVVYVYDLQGRTVYKNRLQPQSISRIQINNGNAYYVVRVVTDDGATIKKVYVGDW